MSAVLIEKEFRTLFEDIRTRFTTSEDIQDSVFDDMVKHAAEELSKKLKRLLAKDEKKTQKTENVEEKPQKEKKTKKEKVDVEKDEEKSKKPLNAYMLFCKEQREKQKGLTAKVLGEMWKGMAKDEQERYKNLN
jgi:hypothetical protein